MQGARLWTVLGGLVIAFLCARADLVTPPTVDWISVPPTATVGQSVSIGVGTHGNYSDNSDGNDWNAGYMPLILAINVYIQRPGESGWTQIHGWLDPWRSPAEGWASFTVTSAGTHYVRVQVMDGRPWYSGDYVYAIGVPSPVPVITSQLSMNVNQGFNTSYQITATNSPTSFGLSGLPPGSAGFNTSTGFVTFFPTTGGTYSSTISAANAAGTDTKTLTWNVTAAVISPSSSVAPTTTTVGVPVTLTRAGFANFGIGWIGGTIWRPDGTLESLGNQQPGSQSYTPTQTGPYTWQVRVVDTSGYNYVDQWIVFTVSGLSAPANLQAVNRLSYEVALSWTSVSGATGYNVYRNGAKLNSSPWNSTAFSDFNAQPSTPYAYSVRAIATDGSESPAATLNVTTAASFVVFTPL